MAFELVYTSSARGLREGTSGFCTVAMTRGLPMTLVPRLEALGGYRPGPSGDGPVALSFFRLETGQGVVNVLTRVGPAAPDHTQRSNKLATYLVLGNDELSHAGPAWLIGRATLRTSWEGPSRWLDEPVRLPSQSESDAACKLAPAHAWAEACGDAGWAGVLASAFLRDMGRPAHVIYSESMDVLALVQQATLLLPDWARWRATFSTYFVQPVAGAPCVWRFCLDGTPAAESARNSKGLVIDLTRPLGSALDSRHVRAARSGMLESADSDRVPSGGAAEHADVVQEGVRGGRSQARVHVDDPEIGIEPASPHASPTWAQKLSSRSARERLDAGGHRGGNSDGGGDNRRGDEEPAFARFRFAPPMLGWMAGGAAVVLALVVIWVLVLGKGSAPAPKGTNGPASMPGAAGHASSGALTAAPVTAPTAAPNAAPTTAPSAETSVAPSAVLPTPPKAAPAQPPVNEPSPVVTLPSTESPAPDPTNVPWVILSFGESLQELVAHGNLPSGVHASRVIFVPPSAFQQAGVVAEEGALRLPGAGGRAVARVTGAAIDIAVPVSGNALEGLSSVIQLPVNANAARFARALLRRVPIELVDESGVLLARARVEEAESLAIPSDARKNRAPWRVSLDWREPTLTLELFNQTSQGRALMDSAQVDLGGTCTLQGRTDVITVTFAAPGSLAVIGEPWIDPVAVEMAKLREQQTHWNSLRLAVSTLEARLKGTSISAARVMAAGAAVKDALNDAERQLLKDDKGNARSLEDPAVLRAVLPEFLKRCNEELERIAKSKATAGNTTKPQSVLAIDVRAQDGFLLYTLYPEGMLK
jgi:hypothetical protein